MTDVDKLIERIVKESGKSHEEIRAQMDRRKEATHGLLTDYGAIYAVAKEHGIDLNQEETQMTEIGDIKPLNSVNVAGRIKEAYLPREFKRKDNTTGKVASILLIDDSGEIRLVLWDNNTELTKRVSKGDILMVKNGYAKEGRDGVEIHASSLTNITINPKLDVKLPEIKQTLVKINEFKDGMSSLDFICRVYSCYPPTEFTRGDGTTGLMASFVAEDNTGKIRVVLWDENAKVELDRGDVVKIENAYTKEGLNQVLEVQIGFSGRIIKSSEKIDLPPIKKVVKINEIEPNMSGFTATGRVIQVFEPRPYTGGKFASLIIGDDSGTTRVVLWNEKSEIANELKKGETIKIENAYSKANLNQEPEIHIGKFGNVIIDPTLDIMPLSDIERSLIHEKDIINLEENDRDVKITGKIVDLEERSMIYMTCPSCRKKVQNLGGEWSCETCGDVEPVENMVISAVIEDKTGTIRAVAFRNNAEQLLGMDVEEVMNLIGETEDEFAPIRQAKESLADIPVSFTGRVNYNDFSDQLEFIVDSVEL